MTFSQHAVWRRTGKARPICGRLLLQVVITASGFLNFYSQWDGSRTYQYIFVLKIFFALGVGSPLYPEIYIITQ